MPLKPSKKAVRITTLLIVAVCLAVLAQSALASTTADTPTIDTPNGPGGFAASDQSGTENQAIQPTARGITVVSTQGFYTGSHPGERETAKLLAYNAAGEEIYRDTNHEAYFDVDPVPGTKATVEYVAADRNVGTNCEYKQCSRNLVERVNLTTGEKTLLYSEITPQWDTGRWHDTERINETHLLIADIVYDRVYIVDTRTSEITWEWKAEGTYHVTGGGSTADWTHINDVELLSDGRIMVSLRNFDQVVFLHPNATIHDEWTIGSDDNYTTLYEQHNPDYIPVENGGPAVVIADSENSRVIEYQRENGSWTNAWTWRDPKLQWPRDADRLPSGNTLITDSHGNRIVEVAPNGTAVWEVHVDFPYDAERLGTGAESTGGHAAGAETGPAPPKAQQRIAAQSAILTIKQVLPAKAVNGLLYITPLWVEFTELLVLTTMVLTLVLWGGFETYHYTRA